MRLAFFRYETQHLYITNINKKYRFYSHLWVIAHYFNIFIITNNYIVIQHL